jgi:hypothetical protein
MTLRRWRSCTLRRPEENPLRKDNKYRRNNNGKVYNYFCPNDGTVSLKNVQGFGWRGIPGELASAIPNLRQRVFCQHVWVGRLQMKNHLKCHHHIRATLNTALPRMPVIPRVM